MTMPSVLLHVLLHLFAVYGDLHRRCNPNTYLTALYAKDHGGGVVTSLEVFPYTAGTMSMLPPCWNDRIYSRCLPMLNNLSPLRLKNHSRPSLLSIISQWVMPARVSSPSTSTEVSPSRCQRRVYCINAAPRRSMVFTLLATLRCAHIRAVLIFDFAFLTAPIHRINCHARQLPIVVVRLRDSMRGYVYALINPSLPDLVKVGKTARSPEERAAELSAATGVPTPFIVGFSIHVSDCGGAERYAHQALASRGFRLSDNREFFRATLNDVVSVLIDCQERFVDGAGFVANPAELQSDDDAVESVRSLSDRLTREGVQAYFGRCNSFRDAHEAEGKFLAAAKLLNPEAHYWLGRLYSDKERQRYDRHKAIVHFRKAFELGYVSHACLQPLAEMYLDMGDRHNAQVAYRQLLEHSHLSVHVAAYSHIYSALRDFSRWESRIRKAAEGDALDAESILAEARRELLSPYICTPAHWANNYINDYAECIAWYFYRYGEGAIEGIITKNMAVYYPLLYQVLCREDAIVNPEVRDFYVNAAYGAAQYGVEFDADISEHRFDQHDADHSEDVWKAVWFAGERAKEEENLDLAWNLILVASRLGCTLSHFGFAELISEKITRLYTESDPSDETTRAETIAQAKELELQRFETLGRGAALGNYACLLDMAQILVDMGERERARTFLELFCDCRESKPSEIIEDYLELPWRLSMEIAAMPDVFKTLSPRALAHIRKNKEAIIANFRSWLESPRLGKWAHDDEPTRHALQWIEAL